MKYPNRSYSNNIDKRRMPYYGWIGILLILIFWPLNWTLEGLRTHWGFFPLWLGYCLLIDSVVYFRKGTSLISRNYKLYTLLFLISAPVWWIFEVLNWFTKNWFYHGREYFTDFQYFVLASISFSTVIPAVFGSAELAGTFKWIKQLKSGPKFSPGRVTAVLILLMGFIMLFSIISFPSYFYPLIWLALYFIIEPLNYFLRFKTLTDYTSQRDWRPVIALWTGCLMCALCWELWNYYSYPKWIYNLPYLNNYHFFEMPLIGYLGYLPFSLELYAGYQFLSGFVQSKKMKDYVQI